MLSKAQGRTYKFYTTNDLLKMAYTRLCQAHGTISSTLLSIQALDIPQGFNPALLVNADNVQASSAFITVETYPIRYAFGIAPTQGVNGLGHVLAAGQSIILDNPDDILNFQFINATNGQTAVLQTSLGF